VAARLYTTYQVANLLGVTPGTVAQWIRNGELRFKRLPDQQIRIGEKHLVTFLKERGIDIEEVMARTVLESSGEEEAETDETGAPALEAGEQTEFVQAESQGPQTEGSAEGPSPIEELAAEVTRSTPPQPAPVPVEPAQDETQPTPKEAPAPQPQTQEAQAPATSPAKEPEPAPAEEPPQPAPAAAASGGGEPARQVIEAVLTDAAARGASHIHLDAGPEGPSLRLRADGRLRDKPSFAARLPKGVQGELFGRLKSLAGLDREQSRLPQAGQFTRQIEGREVHFRLSTCPTTDGERMTIRLYDPARALPRLDQLGLEERDLAALRRILAGGEGMVLVAGPDNEANAAVQRAMLAEIDAAGRNLLVVDKPAPHSLPGAALVPVDPVAGLGFGVAARAALEADADAVVITQFREPTTARLAAEAAVEGRFVLLGTRAVGAGEAVEQLLATGVEPWPLAQGLRAVVAQLPLRKLCEHCKRKVGDAAAALRPLGVSAEDLAGEPFEAVGCDRCRQTGYQGTLRAVSVVLIEGQAARAIQTGSPVPATTLRQAVLRRVAEGHTSPDEAARKLKTLT